MRGVVAAVPVIQRHDPVYVLHTGFRMVELALKIIRLKRFEKRDPAGMDGLQQAERHLDWSQLRIFQFGPGVFVVRLDGGNVFSKRQLAADVSVQVAVRNVVDHLFYRPTAFAVRRLKLFLVQPSDCLTQPLGQTGNLFNVFSPQFRSGTGVWRKRAYGIAKVSHTPFLSISRTDRLRNNRDEEPASSQQSRIG